MKKILICVSLFFISSLTIAQENPSGSAGGGAFWRQGGNTGGPGSPNIFGTGAGNNNPIYTYTNGLPRTRLNGTYTTTLNGVTKPFDGYFGISPLGFFNTNTNTPWSMLHLDGSNNTVFGGGGWRQWMNTGVFMRENSDAMYVGLKQVGINRSDAIINWSDDVNLSNGPDKLRFIFTGANTGNGNGQTDPRDPYALDGYEFMRMTTQGPVNALGNASGHVGIGPLFTDGNFPRSRVHMHAEDNLTNYIQISIDASTGILANDGTRIGVLGAQSTPNREGNALLYNQENKHLLFSTGFATPANIDFSRERVRFTSYNAETNLPSGLYGQYIPDPLNVPTNQNITRVSISHNPLQPVTRPLSLLHLGYNTGAVSLTPGATDGWRSWMDIGMFTSNGTDNVYIGLKREISSATNPSDRHDAVVSWGDNQSLNSPLLNGPDKLRFIFTGTQTGSGVVPPANSQDGLEVGRFYPDFDETFTYNGGYTLPGTFYGRFGVGDFTSTGVNEEPTHKLDVVGNGRFRFLPDDIYQADSLVTKYVMVDTNGVLRWTETAPGGSGVGNYCTATQVPLTNDYEIPLNNFSYNFTAQPNSNDLSRVNIGNLNCNAFFPARLYVRESEPMPGAPYHTAITAETDGNLLPNLSLVYGSAGILYNARAVGFTNHAGVIGISISANNDIYTAQTTGIGVIGTAIQNDNNIGVVGIATNNGVNSNIGIYGAASNATGFNRAGYFNGDLEYTGNLYGGPSDQILKTNIETLENSDSLLNLLNPIKFEYDLLNYPQLNLTPGEKMGLIAQDVEPIFPLLVKESYKPAEYDSLGNLIYAEVNYKTLNYESFIPLLIAGHKEQSEMIKSKDSVINSLQDQINTLYNMITACCNNNSNMQQNNSMQQNQNNTLDITLNDAPSIVLDQNVPNPFAEQTTITYSLVDGVQKAQMLFYNMEGKLIQSVNLTPAGGKGQINVFANDLSTGIYTYTLVVDGEIKGTKRMVKE